MSDKKKVCIIGSGNWGSTIAKIVGVNVNKYDCFENTVNMYVYEEIVDGQKLTEIINTQHENVKYLKGHRFTDSIVAVPDVVDTVKDADILIFVIPHQFVANTCKPLIGKLKENAIGLSLIKGFDESVPGKINLISEKISSLLSIDCAVLMGANIAKEVAEDHFCETTIGCRNEEFGTVLKKLLETPNFRVTVVPDAKTVEICGALKNVVAVAAGICDGLSYGENTKAAVVRIGLKEMIRFCNTFYPTPRIETFFESCGVADLLTTCYGGRNRKISELFAKEKNKTFEELEKEHLGGQKLQGPATAIDVLTLLESQGKEALFPLFVAVARIAKKEIEVTQLLEYLRQDPEC
ncbi:glycerol-3-phosphate dehydrogenase [NAD(+)]: cytoplasmic-like isoform X2 [Leptotrombidium deliense]|uniref:Glycerol-3-phosphate dehydrogenase [NAD(+)] n=1 Tax=Leptotrombidium deliense TaxID=299467 RepID=A0A443S7U1_9ACAR|nr:glycerol-3-phosphate dehydrogenase [NAD(+)]: cytoplasmic-like isoform X2 [Leptotrombidium deliense]